MSTNFLTPIILPAGTSSNAPLNLQSGTNLTNATAGALEYDGKVIYSTPAARGVSPSMMFYRLESGYLGANSTAAQSLFNVGITLNSQTVYAFDEFFIIRKTTGSGLHTVYILFGGTATLNNFAYSAFGSRWESNNANDNTITGPNPAVAAYGTATSALAITGSSAASTRTISYRVQGTISVNAGGTFVPQYQNSTAPGAAYTTLAGSSFAIWPIGAAGANTSVGPWA